MLDQSLVAHCAPTCLLYTSALGLISQPLLDAQWYKTVESILECTVGSVSYTHLDVYKRQPQGGAVPAGGGHPGAGA